MTIKTAADLAAACVDVAQNFKTLYVKGSFGWPMTATMQNRAIREYEYNRNRQDMIRAATADTFGFDCVCFIKALLWGWTGDSDHIYGGVTYLSNGVKDIDEEEMFRQCSDVSNDFSNIQVGEAVWMKGHIGVYIGDGLAVECSPKWENGVQITAVKNIGSRDGYNARSWTSHGKLPYVTYEAERKQITMELPVLKKGAKGETVKAMQLLLIGYGFPMEGYGADASFGGATERALKAYQSASGLNPDGSCGRKTWNKLLGME